MPAVSAAELHQPNPRVLLRCEGFQLGLESARLAPGPGNAATDQHPAVARCAAGRTCRLCGQRQDPDGNPGPQIEAGFDHHVHQQVALQAVSDQDQVALAQIGDQAPHARPDGGGRLEQLLQRSRREVVQHHRGDLDVRQQSKQFPVGDDDRSGSLPQQYAPQFVPVAEGRGRLGALAPAIAAQPELSDIESGSLQRLVYLPAPDRVSTDDFILGQGGFLCDQQNLHGRELKRGRDSAGLSGRSAQRLPGR